MSYPVVVIHPGREQSIVRKHQWLFSRAIKHKDKSIADGDIVSVCDSKGNILATGHYQDSSLAIRILDFANTNIDKNFWRRKFQSAYQYRKLIGLSERRDQNAFRLIHGEGDGLPGLIIDVYNTVGVLQAHSIGMFAQRQEIVDALMESNISLTAVYDKSSDVQGISHTASSDRWLTSAVDNPVEICENGITFLVDVIKGQKTGFFLDQRENRQKVRGLSYGKNVLNCFSYTGGFSLYALAGGAKHVTSIDTSVLALEQLEQNLRVNGITERHQSVIADVLPYLTQSKEEFDVVVCDPPAFAKSLHKRHNAIQAYKRLNAMAMKHVRPGGMLFTFSCSQVVDRQLFHDTIVAAAIEVGRDVRIMVEMAQAADHPVSVFHPEGSYLKGLALCIE